jgi:hypothetical protein
MKSEIGSRRSEVSGRLVVILLAVFAAFALNAGADAREPRTENRSPADLGPLPYEALAKEGRTSDLARPILQPDCKVANGARSFGVKVDLVGLARAKRPTKTVYVEEAVALWRPGYGELIAAAGADGMSDVNAAVKTSEQTVPKGGGEIVIDHLKRNAGKYIGSLAAAAVGGGAYAVYEHNKDDDNDARPATSAATANNSPQNSPQLGPITTGDNSPVTVNISITAMPPE